MKKKHFLLMLLLPAFFLVTSCSSDDASSIGMQANQFNNIQFDSSSAPWDSFLRGLGPSSRLHSLWDSGTFEFPNVTVNNVQIGTYVSRVNYRYGLYFWTTEEHTDAETRLENIAVWFKQISNGRLVRHMIRRENLPFLIGANSYGAIAVRDQIRGYPLDEFILLSFSATVSVVKEGHKVSKFCGWDLLSSMGNNDHVRRPKRSRDRVYGIRKLRAYGQAITALYNFIAGPNSPQDLVFGGKYNNFVNYENSFTILYNSFQSNPDSGYYRTVFQKGLETVLAGINKITCVNNGANGYNYIYYLALKNTISDIDQMPDKDVHDENR